MKKIFMTAAFLAGLLGGQNYLAAQQVTGISPHGVADERPMKVAFINATIYTDYQTVLNNATLLVLNGKIEDVGTTLTVPKDYQIVDLKGKFVYPSFIDLYSDYGMPKPKEAQSNWRVMEYRSQKQGAYHWNQAVRPEFNAQDVFVVNSKDAKELREIGFGTVLTHLTDGIMRGSGSLVTLGEGKEHGLVLKGIASAHFSFNKGSSPQSYPSSLMGSVALLRQSYLDAEWYRNGGKNKEYNISQEAWNNLQSLPQIFEVSNDLDALRADKIGDEFGKQYIIKGAGDEYQRINELKKSNASFIIPVNYPEGYDVSDAYEAYNVSLAELKHWELAPTNASHLANAGIDFAFTSAGLKDKKDFLKNIQKAIEYGLDKKAALKALTFTPAKLVQADGQVGSLQKGKLANFIITNKEVFEKDALILANYVKGNAFTIKEWNVADLRGEYNLTVNNQSLKLKVTGELEDQKAEVFEKDTVKVNASITLKGEQISLAIASTDKNEKRQLRLSGWKSGNNLQGDGQNFDGTWLKWSAVRTKEYTPEAPKDDKKDKKDSTQRELGKITYPFTAFGWVEQPKAELVLFKNATVWTNETDGILKETDVLIENGKIKQVGKNLQVPNAKVIDATGKHLTSGIIDEHSHIAITKGVNEGVYSISSEVRIGDVINSEDINIYRHLAGGVVATQALHGSANAIGGQSALLKMRWGLAPEQMKIENADGFIKFALGENVKQANWGLVNPVRFPQTRMGVEQVYEDAFTRAKEYIENRKKDPINTRKDLQMEALAEILQSKRFITCHSYVQSEINMLMKVAEKYNFRVNTFTHILEGYKVADKMKKHGAAASTFADWWAYKMEVNDAIPYNAAIMTKVGVNTAINSDDAEMARRLNQEAAKGVKYGNLTEEEAWKTVTLNPAKMLHLDKRMGSIKAGKDADLVLWSENPLSIYAKAEKTFVDGVLYFDREKDKQLQQELEAERNRLIQKMMQEKKGDTDKGQKPTFRRLKEYHCEDVHDVWKEENEDQHQD
jgi:imidazolonepropionase-like amidohydrolase